MLQGEGRSPPPSIGTRLVEAPSWGATRHNDEGQAKRARVEPHMGAEAGQRHGAALEDRPRLSEVVRNAKARHSRGSLGLSVARQEEHTRSPKSSKTRMCPAQGIFRRNLCLFNLFCLNGSQAQTLCIVERTLQPKGLFSCRGTTKMNSVVLMCHMFKPLFLLVVAGGASGRWMVHDGRCGVAEGR